MDSRLILRMYTPLSADKHAEISGFTSEFLTNSMQNATRTRTSRPGRRGNHSMASCISAGTIFMAHRTRIDFSSAWRIFDGVFAGSAVGRMHGRISNSIECTVTLVKTACVEAVSNIKLPNFVLRSRSHSHECVVKNAR